MPVTYTARVKVGTLAQRRRVRDGLVNLLLHMEDLGSWLMLFDATSAADGTVTVVMSRAIPKAQLEHLGLNDDGVTT